MLHRMKKAYLDRQTRFPRRALLEIPRIAIPIILLSLLLSQIDARQICKILLSVEWKWVTGGFVLFACLDLWRTVRYRHSLKVRVSLLLPITIVHGSLNTFLPFRLGELSFPYLLGKCGVSIEQSAANLIWVRLLDLGTLCCAVLAISAFGFGEIRTYLLSKVAATLGVILVGVATIWYLVHRFRIESRLPRLIGLSQLPYTLQQWCSVVGTWWNTLREMISPSMLIIGTIISVLIWMENCLVSLFLLRAVGVSLSFVQVAFAVSILQLVSLLPINFLGGLGVLDVSWVGLLIFYGISFREASKAVVATRILFYAYVLIWSLLGWLLWSIAQARKKPTDWESSEPTPKYY